MAAGRGSRRLFTAGMLASALFGAAAMPAGRAAEQPVTVFAAASLADAMGKVAALWAAKGHPAPKLSFASSGLLARQIGAGAPASLFVSADEKWMDWVAAKGLLQLGTREDLLGNTLVLVEPRATLKTVRIGPDFDWGALLGPSGRLAVGDPASVPAGIYAKQALQALHGWNAVANRLAPAENVRAALLLVQRGEAPVGIVYGSDVLVAPDLAVAGTFPDTSHPPIRYPAAVVRTGGDPSAAETLLAFLRTPDAVALFERAGFTVLPR